LLCGYYVTVLCLVAAGNHQAEIAGLPNEISSVGGGGGMEPMVKLLLEYFLVVGACDVRFAVS